MYGIKGEMRAFMFDNACFTFGRALEAELNAVEGKTKQAVSRKRERIIANWLNQPLKFRNPSASPTAGPDSAAEQNYTVRGDGG